MSEVEAITS